MFPPREPAEWSDGMRARGEQHRHPLATAKPSPEVVRPGKAAPAMRESWTLTDPARARKLEALPAELQPRLP